MGKENERERTSSMMDCKHSTRKRNTNKNSERPLLSKVKPKHKEELLLEIWKEEERTLITQEKSLEDKDNMLSGTRILTNQDFR